MCSKISIFLPIVREKIGLKLFNIISIIGAEVFRSNLFPCFSFKTFLCFFLQSVLWIWSHFFRIGIFGIGFKNYDLDPNIT